MARQTVIDWEKDSLLVATTSGRAGSISIEAVDHQALDFGLGESHQHALNRAANELGLGKSSVSVVASRSMVEVRTISVPKVDASELPSIIRFQAQRQLANMGDSWALDYVMLPDSGQEMQTALVGAVAPDQLKAIEKACTTANLQLEHVGLRPIEIARHAIHAASVSRGTTFIVCVSENSADLILTKQGKVVLVRNTNLPSESMATSLCGEVRRSMLAASNQLGGASIDQTVLLTSNSLSQELESPLAEATGTPISVVDLEQCLPASLDARNTLVAQHANRLAGICGGATLGGADKQTTLDFLNPKKAPPKKSKTPTYILAAATLLAVVGGAGAWWYTTTNALDEELTILEEENENKESQVDWARAKLKQVGLVEDFAKNSTNFLDEFAYITTRIPESDKVILAGPHFTTLSSGDGQIRVGIAAESDKSITKFEASIRDDGHEVMARDPQESKRPTKLYKWEAIETIKIKDRGWNLLDQAESREVQAESGDDQLEQSSSETPEKSAAQPAKKAATSDGSPTAAEQEDKPELEDDSKAVGTPDSEAEPKEASQPESPETESEQDGGNANKVAVSP